MNKLEQDIIKRLNEGWDTYFALLDSMKMEQRPYRALKLKHRINVQAKENRIIDSIIEKEYKIKPVNVKKLILIKWNL